MQRSDWHKAMRYIVTSFMIKCLENTFCEATANINFCTKSIWNYILVWDYDGIIPYYIFHMSTLIILSAAFVSSQITWVELLRMSLIINITISTVAFSAFVTRLYKHPICYVTFRLEMMQVFNIKYGQIHRKHNTLKTA